MRVVADTNTVISAFLWRGAPRRILEHARAGNIQLFTTSALLSELEHVLGRPKFLPRFVQAGSTAQELLTDYQALTTVVMAASIGSVVAADADDDAVLACAVAAQAELVVTGDAHLLHLGSFQNIPILTVGDFLKLVDAKNPPASPP